MVISLYSLPFFVWVSMVDRGRRKNLAQGAGSAKTGIVSEGLGYSQFSEIASSMNISIFSEKLFSKLQDKVYNEWEATAAEAMKAANERERLASIAEGRVD